LKDYPTETRNGVVIADDATKALGFLVTRSAAVSLCGEIGKKTQVQVSKDPANQIVSKTSIFTRPGSIRAIVRQLGKITLECGVDMEPKFKDLFNKATQD
jgi:hypothetical protein